VDDPFEGYVLTELIKKDILFIKTTPIKKNIILLKKDNILKSLKILNIIDLR
jgi:hypothetical protein